ncbi:MAG: polymer-forming cytoskeletal protein [Bacteroidales bacterium]|nr:polymer-forming cytoskeletal protein [Bacteroidales bacterium]
MAKLTEPENNAINLIGAGTDIKGDVESTGDIRIDGTLKGNLKTKGKVVIGTTGLIKGEVHCKNSDVEGKIEGKINVQELLSLKTTSVILGDISAKRLAIEPGAKFTGNCNMSSEVSFNEPGPAAGTEDPKKLK